MRKKELSWIAMAVLLCICISTFAIASCVSGGGSTEYDVVKQTKKDNFTYLNESAQKGQLVLIGDSIIEIYNTELFGNYPLTVYNRGISGDTSDRLLERLETNALNINPQKLVVLVGTNDLSRKISDETIVGNIEKMIDASKASRVQDLFICSILPVHKSINKNMVGLRNNSDIQKVNQKLKELCALKQVNYVDINTVLQDKNGEFDKEYTYDGLHPNAKGYDVITKELLKVL